MQKIKEFLKKYSFHQFLLIPYVILYTIATNYKDISLYMSFRPLLIGVVVSSFVFFSSKLILKDLKKSAIFSFVVLLMLSTYGVRYDFLEDLYFAGYWPFYHIHRILVGSDFVLLLTIMLIIKKSKSSFSGVNAFLNTTFSLLILYNLSICIFNYSQTKPIKIVSKIKSNKRENTPNIYYFILDGYANNITLKKEYNYDNNRFLTFLRKEDFFVQDTVFSNFYGTDVSLKSTLNINCFSKNSIYDNLVFKTLNENGYDVNVIKSGYTVTANFKNADVMFQPSGLNELERNLLEHTIFRLDDIIGATFFTRLNNQLAAIDLFISKEPNQFNFIHIVAPHPPYVFDRNGKKILSINKSVNNWEPKDKYVDQLVYISKVIKEKVKKIKEIDKDAIILIQSDHGPLVTSKDKNKVFEARSLILNCVYGPESLKNRFKKTKTSVNTFVHVFNHLFESNLPTQKDELVGKHEFMKSVTFKNKIIN